MIPSEIADLADELQREFNLDREPALDAACRIFNRLRSEHGATIVYEAAGR